LLLHRVQEISQRMLRSILRDRRLHTSLGGAFLTEMLLAHLVVDNRGEVHGRVAFTAVVAHHHGTA
jgi:hypothetical protein